MNKRIGDDAVKKLLSLLIFAVILAVLTVGCAAPAADDAAEGEALKEANNKVSGDKADDATRIDSADGMNGEYEDADRATGSGSDIIDNGDTGVEGPTLGGLRLDMSSREVDAVLGTDYKEELVEEGAYFGEGYYLREYAKGVILVIGKESDKLLQIHVTNADMETDLGLKVGDKAQMVIDKYRPLYKEMESNQGIGTLEGWFLTDDNTVMIFDFAEDDQGMVNLDFTPESAVYSITLSRPKFFD